MKHKILILALVFLSGSINAFPQDTLRKKHAQKHVVMQNKNNVDSTSMQADSASNKSISRNTRLGSSSQKYNTYKKNKSGAGAVTTTPK